jgi:putative flippase GtrA
MRAALHRFLRFGVVGVVATLVHTAVFAVGIELVRIEPVTANAIAFGVAVLVGYALNRGWTFAHQAEHGRLWRYFIGAVVGLACNSAIMYVAVHRMQWSPYIGLAIALVVVPPLSFALNQFWVFRPRGQ